MIIIDRFEADFAVLEVDGRLVDFPRSAIPAEATEGAVLCLVIGPTEERMAEVKAITDREAPQPFKVLDL